MDGLVTTAVKPLTTTPKSARGEWAMAVVVAAAGASMTKAACMAAALVAAVAAVVGVVRAVRTLSRWRRARCSHQTSSWARSTWTLWKSAEVSMPSKVA